MEFESYAFGSIGIDGVIYDHDVVLDGGSIRKRKKGKSRSYRDTYGHTPLSADEEIPWNCRRLVVGTGASGSLPIMDEVLEEANKRSVELVTLPTAQALDLLRESSEETNAILHVTC